MIVAYVDCFSGLSGDMFLGALVDAGVPLPHLQAQLAQLALPEPFELHAAEIKKAGMRACSLEVVLPEGESHTERHLSHILAMIDGSSLSPRVKRDSSAIFRLLAEAEGRVHGEPAEHVHFHEVGAVDSIVDIVGVAVGLEFLAVERLYSSALPYGSGQITTRHGLIPLPAPATLELARLAHIALTPLQTSSELVTPTGAAIVGALATFEQPALTVSTIGIGAGKRELAWPNIARLIVGESAGAGDGAMVLMESNIDDMNPQVYGHVMSRLFEAGALDVYLAPVYMKKNRPGIVLSVIARRADEPRLARLMLLETSTLGLRVQPMRRYEAQRKIAVLATEYGDIPFKYKLLDGETVQAAPEYDVCVRLAAEHGVPLVRVLAAAQAVAAATLSSAPPAHTPKP